MLTLAIIIVGFFYITQLPVDLLPSITYPRIGVRLNAPGVSPEVAIDEVTRPLEQGLSATEGVMQVFSRTREGQVSVDLFFKPGATSTRPSTTPPPLSTASATDFPTQLNPPLSSKLTLPSSRFTNLPSLPTPCKELICAYLPTKNYPEN
jgi:multidrug efflux pump subunit AcrB